MRIRDTTLADAEAIAAVYAPYVLETVVSFEREPPDADEMAARMRAGHLWLVAEHESLVGFAAANPFRSRPAYAHTAETAIYLDASVHRRGIGRRLYGALLDRLRQADFHRAVAGITLPNDASVALHEALGFTPVGVFHEVGRKFDRWHDVGFWELDLG